MDRDQELVGPGPQFDIPHPAFEARTATGTGPGSFNPLPQRRPWTPYLLFVATFLSTFFAGGPQYAGALMTILLAHEMGHYLQSVRYGVPASLPMFIPMPLTPIGTMGAVILQRGGVADRKALFDIAISGPLAGLAVALPALIVGLKHSEVISAFHGGVFVFGEPLLIKWLIRWQFGPIMPGMDVALHPIAFAAWVGILITALNLFPISQLDGGHILYALLRRRAHAVARLIWGGSVAAMIWGGIYVDQQAFSWSLMLFLTWLMGIRHPPTANDSVPLGWVRVCLGWLTLAFLIIGFTPFPIYENPFRTAPVLTGL